MKYKKEIIICLIFFCVLLLLGYINIFNYTNGLGITVTIILILIATSISVIFVERKITINYKGNKISCENIDFMRFIFSIIIIILHIRPFLGISSGLDLAFNNILSRICVPFFFLITGYFIAKKEKSDKYYIMKYIKAMIPLYLVWSAIYLPIIFIKIIEFAPVINGYIEAYNSSLFIVIPLCIVAVPIALMIGLLYAGIYYHLWYFPALICSLIVLNKWKNKFNIKYLLIISFVLLLFGATETYFGFFSINLQKILSYYYSIFFTTRNFLFFGLFYVVLGYFLGNQKETYRKYCFCKFVVCIFLLVAETIILEPTQRLNSNILLSCIPLVYYLFISILYMNTIIKTKMKYPFRSLSKYYYLVHPLVIFIFNIFIQSQNNLTFSLVNIIIVVIITHLITILLINLKRRKPNLII